MGNSMSRKEQRAADIRTSLLSYSKRRDPWGPEYRASAVYRGVNRNNRRRSGGGGGCCRFLGKLIFLLALGGAIWYMWVLVKQYSQDCLPKFEMNCLNESVFVHYANCTINYCMSLSQSLTQLWNKTVSSIQLMTDFKN
ncbi:uncharacterized protein LOC131430473 [Malaya genurostris]|uniref:uncharacterized protein LOC131430473 n=1 Tax=Malaya genurostris TaxID=325434 RepID=UPI0026F3DD8C|nr:uncharacterized protein LOC131430473 [Malaya genurostris]